MESEQEQINQTVPETDTDNPNKYRSLPKMTEKEQYYYRKYGIIRYIRRRIASNKNMLIMMTGQTGSGKSWTAGSIAEMLNEDFNVSRLVFKGKDLMKLINLGHYEYRKGVVIVWDEAGIDLSNRNWYSITNKLLSFLLQTFRHKNFILIFTVPYEDFVDSATKKLFHAQFECVGINRANNTVAVKPKFLQYNAEKKKWYRKYLKVSKAGNRKKTKIKRWNIPKPSDNFIKAYEEKKTYFTKLLNNEIEVSLNKLEGTGFEEKKALTELQTKVLELYKMGITKGKHLSKILGSGDGQISTIKASLFKKGHSTETYNNKEIITDEYIEANKELIKQRLKDIMYKPPLEALEIKN